MKIFNKITYTLSLTILLLLCTISIPKQTEATQFKFTSYTLQQEETINEDIYVFGENSKIDGVVNGDVVVVGETVTLNGTVTGDVYILGSKVDINANIYGNTFVLGNNLNIEGVIAQNTYLASSFLNYNANTEKDLLTFSMDNTVKGSVGDDLRVFGARTTVDSIVKGDLILLSETYSASEEKVTGEIYYSSTIKEIAKSQGVDMDSDVQVMTPTFETNWELNLTMALINFIGLCIVGVVIIALSPVKTVEIRKKITDSPEEFLKSLGIGFAIFVLVPLPLFLLLISFVGTPLGLFLIGLLSFVMMFGKIWVETAFGKEILELFGIKEYRPYKSFIVGRVISSIIGLIPILRGFYNSILVFVALGAIVRMKNDYFNIAKSQNTKKK